jgi:hypothetical protein
LATNNAINTVEIDKAIIAAAGDLIYGTANDACTVLTIGDASDVLAVSAGGLPEWVAPAADLDVKASVSANDTTPGYLDGKLTAGAGIDFTVGTEGGDETLGISVEAALPGGGLVWTVEAASATVNCAVNNGYIANKAGGVAYTIPSTAAVGSIVRIGAMHANGWSIVQGALEYIKFGNVTTTIGAGGSLASTAAGDCVELVCIVADTGWAVLSSVGNITIV